MKYYIIAGEASGDLHGSNLIKSLKKETPNAIFRFWGGDLMKEASGNSGFLVKHYKETAVMGFIEVIASIRKIWKNLSLCKKDIIDYNPDIIILIDYPGFNFRIAKFAKNNNFKVFYYIAPKVWAWKESRIKYLKSYIDRLFIIFPFEIEYFKKHNINAIYNGNPLLDSINNNQCHQESFQDFTTRVNIDNRPFIALLPGSREMEINYLLPKFIRLVEKYPDYQFVIAGAPSTPQNIYLKYLNGLNVKILFNESYSIMKHAYISVLASGTASLEAALLNSPQVVCYGGNEISYQIAKRLVKVKYISLVNLILDQPLVKELIQHQCTSEMISNEIQRLSVAQNREDIFTKYKELREALGGSGASEKVAKSIVEEYNKLIY